MSELRKQQTGQRNIASRMAHYNSDSSVLADNFSGKTPVTEPLKTVDL